MSEPSLAEAIKRLQILVESYEECENHTLEGVQSFRDFLATEKLQLIKFETVFTVIYEILDHYLDRYEQWVKDKPILETEKMLDYFVFLDQVNDT